MVKILMVIILYSKNLDGKFFLTKCFHGILLC